jgi:pilus assembly protein CpaC
MSLIALLVLAAAPGPLKLTPGGQEVLKVPGVTRVAIGRPEIADVQVTGAGELLLLGKARGKTNMLLWVRGEKQNREIIVDDGRGVELERMVRDMVNPSLKVESANGMTVIDGYVDSMGEYDRLMKLVGDDGNVKVLARLNPGVMPALAQNVNRAFQKAGIANARATAMGDKLFLEGSVADEAELKRALLIAEAWVGTTSTNNLRGR